MKLRGDDGYFSRTVTIDGTKFNIRELDDDAYAAFIAANHQIVKESGELAGSVTEDPLALALQSLDAVKVPALMRQAWDSVDAVLVAGVVGWTLPGHECTPETVVLLPNRVKRELMREILRDTQLDNEEQDFSSPSPRR